MTNLPDKIKKVTTSINTFMDRAEKMRPTNRPNHPTPLVNEITGIDILTILPILIK
jgi:hypothetical protein